MADVMRCELDGMVAVLTLNRPEKLNALSNELLDVLMNTLDRIELDGTVRSVVITGAGRAFSAGAGIAAFQDHMRAGAPEAIADLCVPAPHDPSGRVLPETRHRCGERLGVRRRVRAGRGDAHCDRGRFREFSKAEINIRIIPTFGGTQRLPRNVGRKAATELILSGRVFEASEAARLGLVNRVVSADDLLGIAVRLAAELASKPPLTLAAALSAIHRGMDAAIDDELAIEEAAFARIVPTQDAQEGVAAFVESADQCPRSLKALLVLRSREVGMKIIYCLSRLPALSHEDFLRHWFEVHAPLVRAHQRDLRISHYVQVHTAHGPLLGQAPGIPWLTRAIRWDRGDLVREPGSPRNVGPRSRRALGKSAALRGRTTVRGLFPARRSGSDRSIRSSETDCRASTNRKSDIGTPLRVDGRSKLLVRGYRQGPAFVTHA